MIIMKSLFNKNIFLMLPLSLSVSFFYSLSISSDLSHSFALSSLSFFPLSGSRSVSLRGFTCPSVSGGALIFDISPSLSLLPLLSLSVFHSFCVSLLLSSSLFFSFSLTHRDSITAYFLLSLACSLSRSLSYSLSLSFFISFSISLFLSFSGSFSLSVLLACVHYVSLALSISQVFRFNHETVLRLIDNAFIL